MPVPVQFLDRITTESVELLCPVDLHGRLRGRRGSDGTQYQTGGHRVEGKGFVLGLALVVVVLAVLFGVALSSGSADDGGGEDCVSQEYC